MPDSENDNNVRRSIDIVLLRVLSIFGKFLRCRCFFFVYTSLENKCFLRVIFLIIWWRSFYLFSHTTEQITYCLIEWNVCWNSIETLFSWVCFGPNTGHLIIIISKRICKQIWNLFEIIYYFFLGFGYMIMKTKRIPIVNEFLTKWKWN